MIRQQAEISKLREIKRYEMNSRRYMESNMLLYQESFIGYIVSIKVHDIDDRTRSKTVKNVTENCGDP
jgi:hypothetical protein